MSSKPKAPNPRKRRAAPSNRTEQPSTPREDQFLPTKFDLWLQRGSHIAQAGLFVLTIFTLFYTVIPLYQTAALQEGIARQEQELEVLRQQANRAYLDERTRTVRLLAHRAVPECTGLMEPLPDIDSRPPRPVPFFLRVEVASCIRDRIHKDPTLSNLRPLDQLVFKSALDDVLRRIEAAQRRARARYADAPAMPEAALPPHSGNLEKLLHLSGASHEQIVEALRENRVDRHRVDIGSDLRSEVAKLVEALESEKLYESSSPAPMRKGT